jgi:ribonuclease Z
VTEELDRFVDTSGARRAVVTAIWGVSYRCRDGEPTCKADVVDGGRWKVTPHTVSHGRGLDIPPAVLHRGVCHGYRLEAEGKVIAISGDTVDCPGLDRLAADADVLVQCCFLASPEIDNEHLRRLARHTLACGDTVGKIAARNRVKTLVLTHHRPRRDDAMLDLLAEEAARDFPAAS